MIKNLILDLIERELENELQYKRESAGNYDYETFQAVYNATIIKELIEAYEFINKKHFTNDEQLINTLTLNKLIRTYKEV